MNPITNNLFEDPAFAVGRSVADSEIANGKLGYRVYGKLVWEAYEATAAVLQKEFGVNLQVDGHCISGVGDVARTEGYNQRMQEEFTSLFGQDVVAAALRDVERKRKKRNRQS